MLHMLLGTISITRHKHGGILALAAAWPSSSWTPEIFRPDHGSAYNLPGRGSEQMGNCCHAESPCGSAEERSGLLKDDSKVTVPTDGAGVGTCGPERDDDIRWGGIAVTVSFVGVWRHLASFFFASALCVSTCYAFGVWCFLMQTSGEKPVFSCSYPLEGVLVERRVNVPEGQFGSQTAANNHKYRKISTE